MQNKDKTDHEERTQNDDFQFVQEKIKERPINKKKLFRRTVITAVMALMFGLIACVTFFSLEPIISNWLYPEKKAEVVTFPEDEDETMPEDMVQTDDDLPGHEAGNGSGNGSGNEPGNGSGNEQGNGPGNEPGSGSENGSGNESGNGSGNESGNGLGNGSGNEAGNGPGNEPPEPIKEITIYERVEMTAQDYAALYTELAGIAEEAQRSVVTVTGVTADTDWLDSVYAQEGQSSGLIVADNGIELLILATESRIRGYRDVVVTFCTGNVVSAEKKQTDPNTGLCILAVKLQDLSPATMNTATVAKLGVSNTNMKPGTPVIAIGSPTGATGSVCYGMITANSSVINLVDANYRVFATDIYGSEIATGVLINLSGQVVGVIDHTYSPVDMQNQISAIGITELKRTIEAMSNDKQRASIGIHGVDITAALSESLQIPRGVCVQKFEMGSPAMIHGIQGNDIIVAIDNNVINDMRDLTNILYQYDPGDVVTVSLYRKVQEEYRRMDIELTLGALE